MNTFRNLPVTVFLITVNTAIFLVTALRAGAFDGPEWSFTLLEMGAQFNPYTLDGQWYRIFTHMFLHGHFLHLVLNMYALFMIGKQLEPDFKTMRFILIYFLSGVGAALVSLYVNLFEVGVGASGAIFGLFGVALVRTLADPQSRDSGIALVIINFVFFLVINFIFADAFHADMAAHLGGLATGILLSLVYRLIRQNENFFVELLGSGILIVVFVLLPRHQVEYFRFFQRVVDTEARFAEEVSAPGLRDDDYLRIFKQNSQRWDSAQQALGSLTVVPQELAADTFRLRRYISLRKKENDYKVILIREESYIYQDSIDVVMDSLQQVRNLDYHLVMSAPRISATPATPVEDPPGEITRIWFDENWNEIAGPGPYYRIGRRDSLLRWQGPVRDFYANGAVQMKGVYKDDKKHGIFLYYSDHNTYTSAGRYVDNRSVGKWQVFHPNGKLDREDVFDNMMRLKNKWDSSGFQLVRDGYGKFEELDPDGNVRLSGQYVNGLKEGIWFGHHPNGELHFMEEYQDGVMVRGKARSTDGGRYLYDQGSLYPQPDGGYPALQKYLESEAAKQPSEIPREVRLSFRVTATGELSDFDIVESAGFQWDQKAKEIIMNGPRWHPAKLHGYTPTDGYAALTVSF